MDSVIAHLRPHLASGDILIDGGNSFFRDTDRRCDELARAGLHFLGVGRLGRRGGRAARPGDHAGRPARGVGGDVAPILRAIAAKADDGEPCVAYMGPRGAGHYVKMVHNGIEYGDMQLIAEAYDLLRRGLGLSVPELVAVFDDVESRRAAVVPDRDHAPASWRIVDPETKQPIVDVILDEAQQKGTGKWMSQNAFDVGAPIPTVNAAVEARLLSALKVERVAASRVLDGPSPTSISGSDRAGAVEAVGHALYASKITSYAQGMVLLRMASAEYGYEIPPGEVAKIWRAGCIIRARLLGDIRAAFARDAQLVNLLLDDAFRAAVRRPAGRLAPHGADGGRPRASRRRRCRPRSPTTTRTAARGCPANLTQAQRDYFGAHTYRRVDRDGVFHTDWSA